MIFRKKKSSKNRENLHFRDSQVAFEYACEFLAVDMREGDAVVGIVRSVVENQEPPTYLVQTSAKNPRDGAFPSNVAAVKHPECRDQLLVGDLVLWGCDAIVPGVSAGFILYKLTTELDADTGMFVAASR